MDDQHGTLTTKELSWVGGILDGEGSFMIWPHKVKNGTVFYGVRISLRNSSKTMIDIVARILTEHQLAYRVSPVNPNSPKSIVKSRRPMWDIHIDGIKRVKRALDVLFPYVVAKQDQAKILYDFVVHRLEQGHWGGYSVFDQWLCDRLKEVRDSSETMSVTEIYSDDIVRPAWKHAETPEMGVRQ